MGRPGLSASQKTVLPCGGQRRFRLVPLACQLFDMFEFQAMSADYSDRFVVIYKQFAGLRPETT